MKHSSSTSRLLSALVLLCGCGGGGYKGAAGGGIPNPTPNDLNIVGNWQFSATSTVSGTLPLTIAGSINQSGSSVRGAVHVDGSNCFDRLTTMGLTGTQTGSNISLTSTSVAGQVTTFTGSITDNVLTGTYSINGGCANGDHGNVTGIKIPLIIGHLSGSFTTSGKETFDVEGDVTRGSASSEGSFGLTGTVTFRTSCFSSGTITSGTFPSGSFMIGMSVALEIQTNNGTVTFLGTANQDKSEISGEYTVSGGTCDHTGTGVLVWDPWVIDPGGTPDRSSWRPGCGRWLRLADEHTCCGAMILLMSLATPTKSRPKLAYCILPTYTRSKSWPMQKAASRSRIVRDWDSLCFSWLSPANTKMVPCTNRAFMSEIEAIRDRFERKQPQIVENKRNQSRKWNLWKGLSCAQGRCATRLRYAPTSTARLILKTQAKTCRSGGR